MTWDFATGEDFISIYVVETDETIASFCVIGSGDSEVQNLEMAAEAICNAHNSEMGS